MKKDIIRSCYAIIVAILVLPLLLLSSCKGDFIDEGDVNGLALITVDTIKSMSTSTLQEISHLLKTKPGLKVPLTRCFKNYEFILQHDLITANDALLKGNPKFAQLSIHNAASMVQKCENAFKSHATSPLTSKNNEARDILAIALDIIKQLL